MRAGVIYVCRPYSRDPKQLDGRVGTLITPYPGKPRGGAVLRQEGDQFVVLLAGMLGTEPPTDESGMLTFADRLASPDLASVMRESTPLGDPVKYTFPESTWHHYERLSTTDLRFPEAEGKRRPGAALINAYSDRYRAAASVDPVLGKTFLTVANMIDTPSKLLAPSHVLRVFRSAGKAVRQVAE